MKTPKGLYRITPTVYVCEQADCPLCHGPLVDAHYLNGRKTIQTMNGVLNIAYRPSFVRGPAAPHIRSRCPPRAGSDWRRCAVLMATM